MKNSFDGSGIIGSHMGFVGSVVLHESGTRKVRFLVQISRSRMGFPTEGHLILGLDFNFPQTWFLTNFFMHP